jgi:ATP-dependent protease HslVU (ClpYQ) peptidase subunit
MINTAGEVAAGAVNKSLKDIEQSTRNAIEQSRQVSITAVNEMQETSKLLRTDTVALFERLREGNILLQEVLTGAHANLSTLEQALVSRVAEFVSTLNDVSSRTGATTKLVDEQISIFNNTTKKALIDLGDLATQFDQHGKMLTEAARMIDESNSKTNETVADKKSMLDSLVTTLDLRTTDLDQRLSRFNSLLEESMQAAEARAREIARVVADTASTGSSAISQQFEAVRSAAEEERRLTSEAMHEIYQQGTQEADAMLSQAAERFAGIVQDMRQMASEMQRELESTRTELRRGVLEMPQEAAESTAQMRKVIVDQIEALAELNRIVARHGRGLDVTSTARVAEREAEPAMAGGGRSVARPAGSASSLPPPDLGAPAVAPPRRTEAPPMSPAASDSSRDGWLSDLLSRADDDSNDTPRQRPQAPSRTNGGSNPLESLASDIARLLDRDMASDMWDRYQRGERKAFTKRLYTPAGQKTFDEINRKYRAERNFKQTVDRYIVEFERFLDDVARNDRDPNALRNYLTSETGLVYTLLAHAAGRLG